MRTSRRFFLSGASLLAAAMVAGRASAQDVIGDILKSSARGNWDDQFDARASEGGKVASTLPIFSTQTVAFTEQAVAQYQNIVGQGGWVEVPATKKLELGVDDPDVVPLRKRLMVSGDLSQSAGISTAFDSYVDSAVKRFQLRHGLPADGSMGKYTYAAMNVSAQIRLGQLQTNLQRLKEKAGTLGSRYVLVDIPAAQIEAVENDRVVLRHTAIVGKIDRQTPIVNSKINEIIVNPYWNAPVSIVRKDIIPLMRKDPNYLKNSHIRLFAPDGSEVDPMNVDWSTDDAAKYRFRQDPGSETPWRRSRSTSRAGRRLHARHAAAEPVRQDDALRFLGLRARSERARSRHLDPARHARLGPSAFRGRYQDRPEHADPGHQPGAGALPLSLGLVDWTRRRAIPRRRLRVGRRQRTADYLFALRD